MAGQWKKFGAEPLVGIFGVCGTYPEFDVDVDANGETIGCPLGELKEFVALVEIDFDPGHYCEIAAVNPHVTGDCDETYGISHYMPFKKPEGPKEASE